MVKNPWFIRWVNGEIKEAKEADFWDQWIEEDEYNRKIARQAQQILTGVSFAESSLPNIEQEWKQVRRKLKAEFEKKDSFNFNHYKLPNLRRRSLFSVLKVAAIILVVFGASWFFATYFQLSSELVKKATLQTITTAYRQQKTITLLGGSKITLAANSSLSHTKNWLKKPIKHVKLKGEAYFSMVPQKVKNHSELEVQTADGTVSDWGTQFTVSTYGEGTQVVLQEGQVRVKVDSTQKTMTITPGELANFKKSDRDILIKHVNPKVYTSWASNRLVFDHTPLSMLIKRLKRTYGVHVKVENKDLIKKELSGSVGFGSLDMLIHAVNQVLGIHITRKGNTLYINNHA